MLGLLLHMAVESRNVHDTGDVTMGHSSDMGRALHMGRENTGHRTWG